MIELSKLGERAEAKETGPRGSDAPMDNPWKGISMQPPPSTLKLAKLGERFEDERGYIQNVLEQSCGGVSIIVSYAGTSRSHHLHKKDAHWLLVLEGEMQYLERPAGSTEEPARRTIRKGEMVFTPELVEHSTYFPVDTTLLSMSRFERTHASHEADVVRVAPLPYVFPSVTADNSSDI